MIDHFFQVLVVMGSLPFGAGAEPYGSKIGLPIAGSCLSPTSSLSHHRFGRMGVRLS